MKTCEGGSIVNILNALLLGIVQGVAEFLPISSSGHLSIAQNLLGAGNEGAVFVDQTSFETSFYQVSDTAHDFYKKLNEEYLKGIIEAETLTQSYDDYISKITTGAVLGLTRTGTSRAPTTC
jgi:hypothetical protein